MTPDQKDPSEDAETDPVKGIYFLLLIHSVTNASR
jgi:hypothetical protein